MIRTKTMLLFGALAMLTVANTAYAASASGKFPEVIDLVPVTVEQPEALPDPRPVIVTEHRLDEKEVEKLARLLWSSPLRAMDYKKALVWVVMNRAAHGEPFGSSISECINQHEFMFFDSHAHRSDENLRLVKEAMNEWYSRKEGNNVGHVVPVNAYYIRFDGPDNRKLVLMDIDKHVIDWDPMK